jgi:hypothetical protein
MRQRDFPTPHDMFEVPDVELLKTPDERPPGDSRRRRAGWWLALAGLIVGAAIAAYIVIGRRQPTWAPAAGEASNQVAVSQRPVEPLGADAEPIDLPPLDQSDAVVRELVARLSSHPAVAAWLTTDGLIRNFTVVVANIAEARTPAVHLRALRPQTGFAVVQRDGNLYIDPRSYERYDTVAAATASIDPDGAARLYATLKPRIEDAYRDLGAPDGTFDRTLERAIVLLLRTPIIDDPIRVESQGGVGYGFAAPEIEGLSAAQKQLLRAGPRNVRIIQSSLRAIAIALGIPPERLPPPQT